MGCSTLKDKQFRIIVDVHSAVVELSSYVFQLNTGGGGGGGFTVLCPQPADVSLYKVLSREIAAAFIIDVSIVTFL